MDSLQGGHGFPGEPGIAGITLQQTPALKVTADTVSDGVRQP